MKYAEKLAGVKNLYPFDLWREHYENGLEQYTEENIGLARAIVDNLLANLVDLGKSASLNDKLELFRVSVEAMNELNDELDGCLIETGERDELCALYDDIAVAAGIDPAQYGEGDGIASEWRDW